MKMEIPSEYPSKKKEWQKYNKKHTIQQFREMQDMPDNILVDILFEDCVSSVNVIKDVIVNKLSMNRVDYTFYDGGVFKWYGFGNDDVRYSIIFESKKSESTIEESKIISTIQFAS